MWSKIIVVLALIAATTATRRILIPRVPLLDGGRIVGGEETTIEQHPHQVSVRLLGSHSCGGSILSEKVVLTAGHCIFSVAASYYSIQYGVSKIGGSANVIKAERVIKHEKYDSAAIDYDVGLIFLSEPIPFSNAARAIRLASIQPQGNAKAIVSGWGTTSEGGVSASVLRSAVVNIVSRGDCFEKYRGVNDITERMICAAVPGGGKDACQGDSGGPLVVDNELAGIVSWGVGCAQAAYPGVYTNVADVRGWILSNS